MEKRHLDGLWYYLSMGSAAGCPIMIKLHLASLLISTSRSYWRAKRAWSLYRWNRTNIWKNSSNDIFDLRWHCNQLVLAYFFKRTYITMRGSLCFFLFYKYLSQTGENFSLLLRPLSKVNEKTSCLCWKIFKYNMKQLLFHSGFLRFFNQ